MLILPIVNKNRILNVEIKLKNASKIRSHAKFDDAEESEIIVNGKKISDSTYKDADDSEILNFIRSNSLLYRRNYLITTREESNSSFYDVYEVNQPPKHVNDSLDNLYASVVTDMRKEIPNSKKGRYVSFEKLGFDKFLTDEKINLLQRIVKEVRDTSRWPELFKNAGILDLPQAIDFINNFDCTVINDSTIPEDSLQDIIKSFDNLNTKDTRGLSNYYKMALSNRDIYSKLSFVSRMVYYKPLSLIQSKSQKQKQLIKVKDESEYNKVA